MHSCCPMSDFVIIRSHVFYSIAFWPHSLSLSLSLSLILSIIVLCAHNTLTDKCWPNFVFGTIIILSIQEFEWDWEQQVVCSAQHFENYRSNYQVHFSIHVTAIITWTAAAAIVDKAFGVLACLHLNARQHRNQNPGMNTKPNEKKEDRGNRMNEHVIKTNSIIT